MTEEKNGLVLDDGKITALKEFMTPDELYQMLIARVKKYHPSDDISMIEKAYKVASKAHEGQFRKSGEPYIIHPLYVAIILADLEMDKETIVAGILHDVVEDTIMTEEQITEEFGGGSGAACGRCYQACQYPLKQRYRFGKRCQTGNAGGKPA